MSDHRGLISILIGILLGTPASFYLLKLLGAF